ncbi:Response regulator [Sulfidibacter corallicola]|uniref:histidine kinase n=1 Tax=Sulfidibacter corallicola TaxID=2818388 RepID=A0A8A4TMW4_SULCO|nr:ATP-binding protein [Sulfidibacter corallicola]QTD50231.1 response regulator [Sulfidibacter corallicola]
MALFNKKKLAGASDAQYPKPTIMLVDDEVDNINVLKGLLQKKYSILSYLDGQEALEAIESMKRPEEIRVIISDQRMPRLSGTEFFARIIERIPDTVRIILTGYADLEAIMSAINQANIYKFIMKPYDPPELLITLVRAIEHADMKKKVRDYTLNLESMVKKRTRQLQQKNEELERKKDQLVMQEKMASLGTLTAGIAHEFKNPLNFINNFSQVSIELIHEFEEQLNLARGQVINQTLVEEFDGILDDIKTNANIVCEHGKRANHIVDAMLEMVRDTGRKKHEIDFNRFVEEYANIAFHSKFVHDETMEITLSFDLDPNIGRVEVSPQNMGRTILNLVNNALEAVCEAPGQAHPSVGIKTVREADGCVLLIEDNGIGIPEPNLARLFTPFFTTKATGSGHIGLGLSVCYDVVVQEHGGQIKVDSVDGQQTTVRVTLPDSLLTHSSQVELLAEKTYQ